MKKAASPGTMTPELGNAITTLAAEMMNSMHKASVTTPELDWTHAVVAAAIACRGIATNEMVKNPDLDAESARQIMIAQFLQILSLPAELIKIVDVKDGKDGFVAGIIPAGPKH
jgi:hypothetical protein